MSSCHLTLVRNNVSTEGLKKNKMKTNKKKILTPELIVVAAALRLPTAVSRLTDVAVVINAFTVE